MNKGQQRQYQAYLDGKRYALKGYHLSISKYWGRYVRAAFRKGWHEIANKEQLGKDMFEQ